MLHALESGSFLAVRSIVDLCQLKESVEEQECLCCHLAELTGLEKTSTARLKGLVQEFVLQPRVDSSIGTTLLDTGQFKRLDTDLLH